MESNNRNITVEDILEMILRNNDAINARFEEMNERLNGLFDEVAEIHDELDKR